MTIYIEKKVYKLNEINGKTVLIREAPESRRSSKWGRTGVYICQRFLWFEVGILPLCNTGDVAKQKLAGFMRPESGTRTVFQ